MVPFELVGVLQVAAEDSSSGDTLIALVSVFIGAIIAGASTLVGLRIRSKAEREHWLRQERLWAYVEIARMSHEVQATWKETQELKSKVEELEKAGEKSGPGTETTEVKERLGRVGKRADELLTDAYSAAPIFSILGPPEVDAAASAIVRAIRNSDDPAEFTAAQTEFLSAARKALGIR
jgi:hypothetical protein